MTSVYLPVDTGPSGHGQVSRGHVSALLDSDADIDVTVRTHQWGWNRKGYQFDADSEFTDSRFREQLINSDRFNEDYLIDDPDELNNRPADLIKNLGTPSSVPSNSCIIREVESDEETDIWHSIGGIEFAEQAPIDNPNIKTVVETDYNLNKVPRSWPSYAQEADEVWVPNEWVYQAFANRGYTENVHIVPYGVDFSYAATDYDCCICPNNNHSQPPGAGPCIDDDTFTFGAVARWYHIKGVDALIEAYLREFSGSDNVRLVIKTTMNQQAPLKDANVANIITEAADSMNITDIPEMMIRTEPISDQRFIDLMGTFDGFVMASRAECVGISWVQALHAETPVIATNWSAMDEYLTNDHALLLDDFTVEQPEKKQPSITYPEPNGYPNDSEWADPDVESLGSKMRELTTMDAESRHQLAKNGKNLAHNLFDWDNAIQTRINRYNNLT